VFAKNIKDTSSLNSVFTLGALSIKKLTILGFALVAFPLVIALIYSAVQVEQISKQATQSIFSVAALTTDNRELTENQLKLERFASQYVVLKDKELKDNYLAQEIRILMLVNSKLTIYNDDILNTYSQNFSLIIKKINTLIVNNPDEDSSLKAIQVHFISLAKVSQKINQRSIELINAQANKIKLTADQVSNTMLISLLIIPITVVIAGLFIFLITTPLKKLIEKIQSLEKGDFEKKIELRGSPEITEIADALEIMRLRLHALELQKSSFIRHISHELKTPLAAIREGTELLYDNSVGELNDEQQEVCHIIKASVSRLQRLIEDLLDFNIVLDSTSLQDSEKIYLKSLLDSVLADHKLDVKRKGIAIKQDVDNILFHSNAKQLKVVLDNVLSNAIKYSPMNSSIEISSTFKDKKLQLSIIDQGPGISPEIKEKVFDAFYQGPAPENNQIKGSGLGLTIVKELLMRLNGEINIVNQQTSNTGSKKVGTWVQIILPRAKRVERNT
jgi:two-component system sensor histidine kinase GlrK